MQPEIHGAALQGDGEPQSGEAPPEVQKAPAIPKLDASLALWLILFVFGGGLLALYYAGIDYFPEVTWQDALTFMALMTIIGGSLLVAYSFLLFVPGAIWSEFLIFDEHLHHVLMMNARRWEPCVWSITKHILFPFAVFMAFCHFLLYEDGPRGFVFLGSMASLVAVSGLLWKDLLEGLEKVARKKAGAPSTAVSANRETKTLKRHRIAIAASHSPMLMAFIVKASQNVSFLPEALWVFALLPLLVFLRFLGESPIERRLWRRRRASENAAESSSPPLDRSRENAPHPRPHPHPIPDKVSLLCRAILGFGSASLLSLTALWFFHRIYRGGTPKIPRDGVPWGLLVLCTLVVIVTNLVVSVLFHKHRRQALFTSFLAALLLLGAGQLIGADPAQGLPAKIMEQFGFGGQSASLVLTERGGRLLCQQAIPVQFEERAEPKAGATGSTQAGGAEPPKDGSGKAAERKPDEEKLLARVDDVTILSRLGSEYLLRDEKQKRTIALPKEEVVSWSTRPKDYTLQFRNDCTRHGVAAPLDVVPSIGRKVE